MDSRLVDVDVEYAVKLFSLSLSLLLFTFAFLLPLGAVLFKAVEVGFSLDPMVTDGTLWSLVRFTYVQAALSALLAGIVGIPIAFWLHDRNERWARGLWYASLVPFSTPGLLYALCYLGVWHSFGLVSILVAHCFLNFPLYVRWVGLALQRDQEITERAALALGASRWQCFRKITWPKIRSACAGSFLISFLYCASSLVVVMLLGGNPRYTTLEVALYENIRMLFNLNRASILAIVQLSVFAVVVFLSLRFHRLPIGHKIVRGSVPSIYRPRSRWVGPAFFLLFSTVMFFLVVAPLGNLVRASLPGFAKLNLSETVSYIGQSLRLSALTAILSVMLSFGFAYGAARSSSPRLATFVDTLSTLPLAVSVLTLGLGILILYPLRDFGLWSLIPISTLQAVGVLPLASRAWQQSMRRIPEDLRFTAASLGASPWQVFARVEAPLLRGALGLVIALSISYSLGEMGSLLLFYSSGMETLSTEVYRRMGRYDFDSAYAIGVVLLATVLVVNWIAGWFEEKMT